MTMRIRSSNPLNQPGAFDCRWIVGATSGAAFVPNSYRLLAGNADDTTSFENYPMFHTTSLERLPKDGNGRFGAGDEPSRSVARLLSAQAVRTRLAPVTRPGAPETGSKPRLAGDSPRFHFAV